MHYFTLKSKSSIVRCLLIQYQQRNLILRYFKMFSIFKIVIKYNTFKLNKCIEYFLKVFFNDLHLFLNKFRKESELCVSVTMLYILSIQSLRHMTYSY